MRFTHLLILLYFLFFLNCKDKKQSLFRIEAVQISINDSIIPSYDIQTFIKPYRDHIKKDLDSVLAYSVNTFSKTDGYLNTAIGNYMADAVYTEANPVFKKRTGLDIDMVLLNYGGIRAALAKGNITSRSAYELMPFENNVVVVALRGAQIDSLIQYLCESKTAHPISKLQLTLNKDFQVLEAKINEQPIDKNNVYNVATSDFLYNGGDHMTFFKTNDTVYALDYKIRNILIDNFKKMDTINPVRDNRFIQIK